VWRARAFGASRKRFCVHLRAKARERLHALVTHGLMLGFQIAPAPRMAGRAARFAADVGGEEKHHIRVSAGAERYGDERGAAMDLRHDGRGDQFAFSREGASVFEALEPVPGLKRLRRALAHCAHAADPGRLARHEAEMTDDRNLLMRKRPHRFGAAAGQHRIGASGDRREGGAQNLVGGHGLGEAKRRGDEDALRALAHARDISGAADDHFNTGGFGGGRLVRRLGRYLSRLPTRAFQHAKTGDGLGALDVATAEVEDARHQPFLSFLA
jgi:hypothetical protein